MHTEAITAIRSIYTIAITEFNKESCAIIKQDQRKGIHEPNQITLKYAAHYAAVFSHTIESGKERKKRNKNCIDLQWTMRATTKIKATTHLSCTCMFFCCFLCAVLDAVARILASYLNEPGTLNALRVFALAAELKL